MAREGAANGVVGRENVIGTSTSYIKQPVSSSVVRSAFDYWLNLPSLAHSKAFIRPSEYSTKQLVDYYRDDLLSLTGHLTAQCLHL